jgi:RNA polymerase sigma-70 factor (ECF subfamily)
MHLHSVHRSSDRPCESSSNGPTSSATIRPEIIHARYAARIRRRVHAVLGTDDERDDLVQEVLMTAVRKLGTVRDPTCLDAWVAKVTANTLKYFLRRRRLRRHASFDAIVEAQIPATQPNPDARDLAERVIRVIQRLPERDRALLTTYWFTPETAKTLAAKAGCSDITLRRRLTRARLRFEKLARQDPALVHCFDDSKTWWHRWHPRLDEADDADEADDVEGSQTSTAA